MAFMFVTSSTFVIKFLIFIIQSKSHSGPGLEDLEVIGGGLGPAVG